MSSNQSLFSVFQVPPHHYSTQAETNFSFLILQMSEIIQYLFLCLISEDIKMFIRTISITAMKKINDISKMYL